MVDCKWAGKVERYGKGRRKQLDKNQAMRSTEDVDKFVKTKPQKIHPNIFTYSCGASRTGHPAVFPEQLAEDHITSWSNEGDVVFDPFLGAGTTAKMAVLNNRHYIGFELSEEYFDIACRRLDEVESVVS